MPAAMAKSLLPVPPRWCETMTARMGSLSLVEGRSGHASHGIELQEALPTRPHCRARADAAAQFSCSRRSEEKPEESMRTCVRARGGGVCET